MTAQPSSPFAERATERCEIPVRASTLATRTVSPATTAAAGLKTALTGYGQSSAVRIGFSGWRRKSSRCGLLTRP